ncbi:MAG: hypothetical protein GY870_22480, partial [archaeon]|nr:hypothetical protein [archaeon]
TKDLWKDIQDNAEDIYLSDDDEDGTLTEFYKENNLEFGIEDGDDDTNEKPVEEVAEEKTEELEEEVLPEPEKEVEKPAAKKAVKKKSPKKETKETNMTAPAFNKTFIDYIRMLENNEINPNPAFQRKSGIWKKGDNINFIKTLLSGLPIPEFYIGEIDDEVCLFDGLQRTTALWDWYTGELQGTIKQYKNLSKAELKTVNSFPFVFRDCGKIKEEVAEEIFTRLNATSYSLNKIEILNAAFSGEFISTAQELVKNKLFSSINLFPENQVKRMLDVEYILILMSTFEDSYFAGSSPIKKFVKDLDSEYENKDKFIDKFEKVCKLIISCKLEKGSIWTKKAALFSLISELMVAKKLPKKDA